MRDAETRSLRRAAVLLLVVSLVRWGWSLGSGPKSLEESVLPELLAESREEMDEEQRRSRPLADGERIDPNRADGVELDRLPGIGPSTAEAIVAARRAGTVFRLPDDLLTVRGIGPATLARIRPALDLSEPPARSRRAARGRVPGRPTTSVGRSRVDPFATDAPIDVNRADADRLEALPGVGPAIAERIVSARQEQLFTTVDDLIRVRGIGTATVERLRPLVTVGR